MEKSWNAAMRWYSRLHHRLAQDWPRLDGLCHMVFYYSFFAIKKVIIFLLNMVASLFPNMGEVHKRLPKPASNYMELITETHSDIQQINGEIPTSQGRRPSINSWFILQSIHMEGTMRWLRKKAESMRQKPQDVKEAQNKFDAHKELSRYALNIYDASVEPNRLQQKELMRLDSEDISEAETWFNEEELPSKCPKFGIFIDGKHKKIVLSIRGTMSYSDIRSDLDFDEVEVEDFDGFAHYGILEAARNITNIAKPKIMQKLGAHPDFKVLVTGHSLGAGAAILSTIIWLRDPGLGFGKVECLAFAPPPVIRFNDKTNSEVYRMAMETIDIYIHRHDIVPRLSKRTFTNMMGELHAVDQMQFTEKVRCWMGYGNNLNSDDDSEGFLEYPGRINFLIPAHGTSSDRYWLSDHPSEKLACRFRLHPHFFVDHLPTSYEYAMEKTDVWSGSHREDLGTILREMTELKRSFADTGLHATMESMESKLDGILDAVESVRSQVEQQGAKIERLHNSPQGQHDVRGSTGSLQRQWTKKDKRKF